MKIVAQVLGVLLIITGVIWILQGVNILPGSFMTGQTRWAIYGAVALGAGALLMYFSRRLFA